MHLRPDEAANEAEIERDRRLRSGLAKGAKAAVGAGLSYALPAAAARVMPFLSEYIPTDLAMKGIKKVSPKIASFLEKGKSMGLDVKEGLQYVKEQIGGNQEQGPAKTDQNLIQQYDPELHQYIDQEIRKGRSSTEAGALAQLNKKFMKTITKITKDHKTPWSGILQSVYGGGEPQQEAPQESQQQSGQGQAALMAILQKIQQARGGQ